VSPTIDGFTITGGRSGNHGGGLRLNDSNALIRSNVITDNVGYLFGGGVWVQRGSPRFESNRIEYNRVTLSSIAYGGGIELEGTRATLINNVIARNVVSSPTDTAAVWRWMAAGGDHGYDVAAAPRRPA
jgi:hypothetical protein